MNVIIWFIMSMNVNMIWHLIKKISPVSFSVFNRNVRLKILRNRVI